MIWHRGISWSCEFLNEGSLRLSLALEKWSLQENYDVWGCLAKTTTLWAGPGESPSSGRLTLHFLGNQHLSAQTGLKEISLNVWWLSYICIWVPILPISIFMGPLLACSCLHLLYVDSTNLIWRTPVFLPQYQPCLMTTRSKRAE